MSFPSALILTLLVLAGYLLPTLVAVVRRKNNSSAIFALNFFLGWSFIGWVIALVWACTTDRNNHA